MLFVLILLFFLGSDPPLPPKGKKKNRTKRRPLLFFFLSNYLGRQVVAFSFFSPWTFGSGLGNERVQFLLLLLLFRQFRKAAFYFCVFISPHPYLGKELHTYFFLLRGNFWDNESRVVGLEGQTLLVQRLGLRGGGAASKQCPPPLQSSFSSRRVEREREGVTTYSQKN